MHLSFIGDTCARYYVSDSNVYEAQMCTLFYYNTDKFKGGWCCGSTLKDRVPDQEGLLQAKYLPV